jgi:hypothetical protein
MLTNATLAAATPVDLSTPLTPSTLTDTIASATDVHIYAVDLTPLEGLSVQVHAQDQGSSLAGVLRLFSSSGKQLEVRYEVPNFDGPGFDPALFFATPTGGRYYVGVSGLHNDEYDPNVADSGSGYSEGPFAIDFVPLPGAGDSHETLATAEPLPYVSGVLSQVSGNILDDLDVHFYRLNLPAGALVSVGIPPDYGMVPRVFAADGSEVPTTSDGSLDTPIQFRATVDGTYFIGVSGAGNTAYDPNVPLSGQNILSGPYVLNVRVDDTPTPDLAGASFTVMSPPAAWGTPVTVNYTLRNLGTADAGPFQVWVQLSPTATVSTSDQTLAVVNVPGLAAQRTISGSVQVVLPGSLFAPPPPFTPGQDPYLGLIIDPTDQVREITKDNNSNQGTGIDLAQVTIVQGFTETEPNDGLASANPITPDSVTLGAIRSATDQDFFAVTVDQTGRLTAEVDADPGSVLHPRLSLYGAAGQLLGTSDGEGPAHSDSKLTQDLAPGDYYLAVSPQSGAGSYQLRSEFVPSNLPFQPLQLFANSTGVAVADVNGDGKPDLITPQVAGLAPRGLGSSVEVQLGNGDGTFQPPEIIPLNGYLQAPFTLFVADVSGDGKPDLVVADSQNAIRLLLGNGDSSFQSPESVPVNLTPPVRIAAVTDVNGDGRADLLIADDADNTLSLLLSNGDGTFQPPRTIGPSGSVFVADVNGDGKPDLIISSAAAAAYTPNTTVSVLFGNGDGTFRAPQTIQAPAPLAVADVNGDGKPDLITVGYPLGSVDVLLGNGDGSFQAPRSFPAGAFLLPAAVVADVNGDGRPDLLLTAGTGTMTLLLGNGDGTFQGPRSLAAGSGIVAVTDLNGDGRPDLVVTNDTGTISVLLGNGDGSFQHPPALTAGSPAEQETVADVNGDGKPDLITFDRVSGTVSVLLGNGDGSFQDPRVVPLPDFPTALAVADVNGDGRPDLVVTTFMGASVLLGNGDGSFQEAQTFPAGADSFGLAVADVNGDGKPDLIVTHSSYPSSAPGTVSVLLGNGDGSFQPAMSFPAGPAPSNVTVADVNGDGKPDLITFNTLGLPSTTNSTVSVLLGNGDGTFQVPQSIATDGPLLAVADVNGDGKPDLLTAHLVNGFFTLQVNGFSVLAGNGDGTFQPLQPLDLGSTADFPILGTPTVAVADLDGDGRRDLIVAESTLTVYLQNGAGSFRPAQSFPVGSMPSAVAVADVNGDGRPDLLVTESDGTVSVLLANGTGSFTPATTTSGVELRNTPYLADLNGDGIPDSVVLDRSGAIRFRRGLPDGELAPPPAESVNAGRPARDLTVLRVGSQCAIATADAGFDPTLSAPGHFIDTVSLYTFGPDGAWHRRTALATPYLPTRVAAADLNGDGLPDLIVADALDDRVQIAFQQPDGSFGDPLTLAAGDAPSDIAVVDVNGDGRPDLVVTNQASGDVSVFLNDPGHTFATSYRFRAGAGPYAVDTTDTSPAVSSLGEPVALAAGDFTGDGRSDLVVVNRGSHSFTVLANDGSGGFADPQAALTTSTSEGFLVNNEAGPVVAGDFNSDGKPDLAILMEDRAEVWVYIGDGSGHFTHTFTASTGTLPTGLSLYANPQTGFLDLLVGNQFGDVLHLQGKGDGTFQFPGSRVSLAVQDLGNGQPEALVANKQTDRVTVQAPTPGTQQFVPVVTLADGTQSTLAPGAVQWAKLDRASPYFDAVVLASGGNEVLVYRGTGFNAAGRPTFAAPVGYPVGTDPEGLTIQDINGDGIPDLLVSDHGSNDVTILFGSYDAGGAWVGVAGPRLKSGGSGPVATTLRDLNGDGIPDLVVTNSQDGTLVALPGIGHEESGRPVPTGFFNDVSPLPPVSIPGNPVIGAPSFISSTGVGVVPTADGRLFGINLNTFRASSSPVFAPPSGQGVAAVQALANGKLVVAEQGGTVELLGLNAASSAYEPLAVFMPLTGIPSDPSALAVLESGQVLVTNEGEDQLFVFGLAPSGAPGGAVLPGVSLARATAAEILLPPQKVAVNPVVEPSSPREAPLALVLTLVAGVLPSGAAAADAVTDAGNAGRETEASAPDPAGAADEDEAPPKETAQADPEIDPDIGELLRQLKLYRKGVDDVSGQPITRVLPGSPTEPGNSLPAGPRAPAASAEDLGAAVRLDTAGRTARFADADPLDPAGAQAHPVVNPEVLTRLATGLLPATAADHGRDGVLGPQDGREWVPQILPALAAAGLAFWAERGLLQVVTRETHLAGANTLTRPRRGRARPPGSTGT